MPYKLTVDIPDGQEVFIPGLGTFAAGTHDISDEQAETYEVLNTTNVVNVGTKGPDDKDEDVREAETVHQRGLALVIAVEGMNGITIEQANKPKPRTPTRPVESGSVGSGVPGSSAKTGGES